MNQSINIDKAARQVKNLIDNNRCAICVKSIGNRVRYPCGHTSCDDCVPVIENCPICLTQDSSTFATPSIDTPNTQRSQNANILLNVFQTEFTVDVNKRQRISEQLKIEKELFPQCIQAPAKYFNKRKSSKHSINKENNTTVFPGEVVSSINKMENSKANVREWLNKCVKRKPLRDLNHSITFNALQKQPHKVLNTQNIGRSQRKRQNSEIWADENQTIIDEHVTPSKNHNKGNNVEKLEIKTNSQTDLQKGKNKDDSVISIEDDSVISIEDDGVVVIDDSQSVRVDKDMNTWLAVIEAEKYAQCGSTTLGSQETNGSLIRIQPHKLQKVPFYVKSPLSDSCEHCSHIKGVNNDEKSKDQPNISITVKSKSFTAIINVSKAQKSNNTNTKQSVEIQTDNLQNIDDQEFDERFVSESEKYIEVVSPIPCSSKSEDVFLNEANLFSPVYRSENKPSNITIAESDSDEDFEHSTSLQVTADVHRSNDEILVLGDIDDLQEHGMRQRRAARGNTPNSTDSSDKENFNPNRKMSNINSKKKPVKKT